MAEVVYAPEADDDLESIVDYIARDKPRAAREWLLKLRENCEKPVRRSRRNQAWVKNAKGSESRVAVRSALASMSCFSGRLMAG